MSVALSLQNDLPMSSTPFHSTASLEPPSTPSSTTDSVRPKSEHRVSLGVLESAKFRLSHDVRRPVASSLSPFYPLLYLTRVGRTLFFAVCTSRPVIQLSFFKVDSHRKDSREFISFYRPWNVPPSMHSADFSLLPIPTEHTRLARVGLRL